MFALALPSAASASEVHITPADNLFLNGDPGENNDVSLSEFGGNLVVEDAVGVTAGTECAQVNATKATCPLPNFTTAYVFLDNGNNVVDSIQSHPIHIDGWNATTNHFESFGAPGSTLIGGPGADTLSTGGGNDHLNGNAGPDNLSSRGGNDVLDRGSEDDVLNPGFDDDEVHGQSGTDSVNYSARTQPLHLSLDGAKNDGEGAELDNIHGDVERIYSGSGSDDITGSANRDLIQAGDGNDNVEGGGGNDELHGENGNDELHGGSGVDFLNGGNDEDEVDGGFEGDLLVGGPGNDNVNGAQGDDQISGGTGDDQIDGGIGDDEIQGNAGDDTLTGGQGRDELTGQADNDTVTYAGVASPVTVDLDGSTYDDGAENEGDTVGADVENVTGGAGPDKITGNDQQNVLIGAQGDDTIDGGANNDTLIGASGSDSLHSKDGVLDVVDCGIDADTLDADPVDQLTDCELPPATPGGGEGTEQPPVTPPPTPPVVSPKLVIGPGSARVSRSRFVKLSVSCPKSAGGTCIGTLRLQRTVKGKVKTFGSKGFKVPAGSKRTLKIKVSKKTAKSIARKPLKVNAVSKSTAGASDASRKVTLKPAARRKR